MSHQFPKFLLHDHGPENIRERLLESKKESRIKDFIYGGIDGIVTTFAIVAGVKGAELSKATILILGLSNIIADGFSMAASNYLGTKAQNDQRRLISEYESAQIDADPEGEREEIKQIFIAKGFTGHLLDEAVLLVTKNRKQWVNTMLHEEYGLASSEINPLKAGLNTFISFLLFGLIPLIPYLFGLQQDFTVTIIFTGVAFFILGSIKSKWSLEAAWVSGFKTLLLGSLAASFAFIIGWLLRGLT